MRLKEAQQHDRSCIDGRWQRLELNLECPRPESVQVTLIGLGLCDQLKENPDAKVKGEIWAEQNRDLGLLPSALCPFPGPWAAPTSGGGRRSGCFPALFVQPAATD